MERIHFEALGKEVSRLCFGALTISPLQRDFDVSRGASLMREAYAQGINFFDTADLYGNYPQMKAFLASGISRDDVVIATKSYAYDRETADRTVERALVDMGVDRIDVFLLHEQESAYTLRGHREALERLIELKSEGVIGAVGISTHHIAALAAVESMPEIEVVHAIVNVKGIGIADGSMELAEKHLRGIKQRGGFIYGMKPLGGGHLIGGYEEAMRFALGRDYLDAIAIGMQSEAEITANRMRFEGLAVPESVTQRIIRQPRQLLIHDWCIGCGKCVARCDHNALDLENGKATVNQDACVFCGYCASVCPEMCIKVI